MGLESFDPEVWQPVRLPNKSESRNADFPPLDTFVSREHENMTRWCEKNCVGGYLPVTDKEGRSPTVFWFEQPTDAAEFALQWFPFKCL